MTDWIGNLWDEPKLRKYNNKTKKKKKGNSMNLKNGDRVRLIGGKRPMIVTHSYNAGGGRYKVTAQYEGSGGQTSRYDHEFVQLDEDYETESKGIDKMKGKLFQTKEDTPRFGIGLAVNSQNEFVLEMKVTGALEAFTMKKGNEQLEVVMPYSFAVKYSTSPQLYQYRGREGSVAVGDLLLSLNSQHAKGGISIAQVVEINTKNDKATKSFDGMKIVTEPLDGE
jgi:hypothetical protein